MGADTKLYVEVQDHMADRIDVIKRAHAALEKKIREYLDIEVERRGYENRLHMILSITDVERLEWTNGLRETTTRDFNMFTTNFGFNGEQRVIYAFIDCDVDMTEFTGLGGVVFDLGCWGKSDEIMRVIIDELWSDYPMWYKYNDCEDEAMKVGNHG